VGRFFVTPFHFYLFVVRDGSGQVGIPRRVLLSFSTGNGSRHSILRHSFLAVDWPGLALSEPFYGRFHFHVSSIITIILSKVER
jgi:hypothetical protein